MPALQILKLCVDVHAMFTVPPSASVDFNIRQRCMDIVLGVDKAFKAITSMFELEYLNPFTITLAEGGIGGFSFVVLNYNVYPAELFAGSTRFVADLLQCSTVDFVSCFFRAMQGVVQICLRDTTAPTAERVKWVGQVLALTGFTHEILRFLAPEVYGSMHSVAYSDLLYTQPEYPNHAAPTMSAFWRLGSNAFGCAPAVQYMVNYVEEAFDRARQDRAVDLKDPYLYRRYIVTRALLLGAMRNIIRINDARGSIFSALHHEPPEPVFYHGRVLETWRAFMGHWVLHGVHDGDLLGVLDNWDSSFFVPLFDVGDISHVAVLRGNIAIDLGRVFTDSVSIFTHVPLRAAFYFTNETVPLDPAKWLGECTPWYDQLVKTQLNNEENAVGDVARTLAEEQMRTGLYKLFNAMIGRTFMFTGSDNMGTLPFIIGGPGTGKSTVLSVRTACNNIPGSIPFFSGGVQAGGGLNLSEVAQCGLVDNCQHSDADSFSRLALLTCSPLHAVGAASEPHTVPFHTPHTVPWFVVGRRMPPFSDAYIEEVRQAATVFWFRTLVTCPDTAIAEKIIKYERAAVFFKQLYCYRELLDEIGSGQPWSLFVASRQELLNARDNAFAGVTPALNANLPIDICRADTLQTYVNTVKSEGTVASGGYTVHRRSAAISAVVDILRAFQAWRPVVGYIDVGNWFRDNGYNVKLALCCPFCRRIRHTAYCLQVYGGGLGLQLVTLNNGGAPPLYTDGPKAYMLPMYCVQGFLVEKDAPAPILVE